MVLSSNKKIETDGFKKRNEDAVKTQYTNDDGYVYSKNVDIIYCSGNHDEFVGWHLVNWLKSYFRNQKNLRFDDNESYTKFTQIFDIHLDTQFFHLH